MTLSSTLLGHLIIQEGYSTQWSKWPKFVSFYYWHTPRGVKNPDDQTEVHSGELERQDSAKIEETLKNVKIEQKLSKKLCFLKGFWMKN